MITNIRDISYQINNLHLIKYIFIYRIKFPKKFYLHILGIVFVFIITISGMRASYGCFKNAAGIFYEDRFVPIVEAFVNLVTSIPLAMLWGVKGVLLGTIISTMVLYVYTCPKFIYSK